MPITNTNLDESEDIIIDDSDDSVGIATLDDSEAVSTDDLDVSLGGEAGPTPMPTISLPLPRVYTDTELGYDPVDPGDFDFPGAAASDYLFGRRENPEGIESLYAPVERDPQRDDWHEGKFRESAGYEGDWLTEDQFTMVSEAENFIESLLLESDAAGFGPNVDAYMNHLSRTNEALFRSHSIDLNKSNFAFDNYGELYRFQQNISAAEWSAETGTLSQSALLDNARLFLWQAVTAKKITPERYAELVNDPVALMSLITDGIGNIDLTGPILGDGDFAYMPGDTNQTQPYVLIDPNNPQSGYRPYHPPGSWVDIDGALLMIVEDADGNQIITELMPDAYSYEDLGGIVSVDTGPPPKEIHYFPNDPTHIRPYMRNSDGTGWVPLLLPGQTEDASGVWVMEGNVRTNVRPSYEYGISSDAVTPEVELTAAQAADFDTSLAAQDSALDALFNPTTTGTTTTGTTTTGTTTTGTTTTGTTGTTGTGTTTGTTTTGTDGFSFNSAGLLNRQRDDDGNIIAGADNISLPPGYHFLANDRDGLRLYRDPDEAAGEDGSQVVLWAGQYVVPAGINAGKVFDNNIPGPLGNGWVRDQLEYNIGRNDSTAWEDGIEVITEYGTELPHDLFPIDPLTGLYDLDRDAERADEAVLHLYANEGTSGGPIMDLSEDLRTGFGFKPNFNEDDWLDATEFEAASMPSNRVRALVVDTGRRTGGSRGTQSMPGGRSGSPIYRTAYRIVPMHIQPNYYEEHNLFVAPSRTPVIIDGASGYPAQFAFSNEFAREKRIELGLRGSKGRDARLLSPDYNSAWNFAFHLSNDVQTFFTEKLIDYMIEKDLSMDSIVNSEADDILSGDDNPERFDINDFMTGTWAGEEADPMTQELRSLARDLGGEFGSDAVLTSLDSLKKFALFAAVLLEPINTRIEDEVSSRDIAGGYTGSLSIPAWYEQTYGAQPGPILNFEDPGNGVGESAGGYIDGWGGGMDDTIPAITDGTSMSALSSGEFVIPADVVSHLGDGNNQNGASKLYQLLDEVRTTKTGMVEQPAPINDGIVSNILGDHNG
jgi:hypothetical protein